MVLGPGDHRIYTHFPKDRNCDICLRTKIIRASCRRRTGTIVPRADIFSDLMTADHKVLGEGRESRHNHRHAVVVQDFATRWLQSYPCKTKTSKDIISRLLGCDGQAADAVSAYTQVKMEDAHKLLKIPKSECPDIWIRLPRHKWPKTWSSMEDPVVPLERNLYGHPLAGLLWEGQFEKILLKHGWEKIPNWECLFVHREKGLFLSVFVDDIKFAGKKQNLDPMWKVLNKEVDFGRTNIFP